MTTSPASQPRNVILGHCVSALAGVMVRYFANHTGMDPFATAALAVSLAIGGMRLAKAIHPPGGATALIAVTGGPGIYKLGFAYALTASGAAFILVGVGVLLNNLCPQRRYPLNWF
jgi:CBS domain-containing membrane protein